jgi:hypothetical protein
LEAVCFAGLGFCEDFEGFCRGEGVGDVPEVDEVDDLLGRHVCYDSPDGPAEGFGPEVPDGIDDSAEGEVDDSLFGSDPAELRVVDEMAPCFAPVFD